MQHLIEQFAALMVVADRWAGPLFFLLAFGESLAIVGTIIPATPFLFLVGNLLGSGKLAPGAILPWAILGALAGYWVSWRVGRRIGSRIFRTRLFVPHRRDIARVRLFFRRWGGPSLVTGRFVLGPLQSMLPLVAGAAAMNPRSFHLWNLLSSLLWVFVVLTPGYLAARGIRFLGFGPGEQHQLLALLIGASGFLAVAAVGYALFSALRSRVRY